MKIYLLFSPFLQFPSISFLSQLCTLLNGIYKTNTAVKTCNDSLAGGFICCNRINQ